MNVSISPSIMCVDLWHLKSVVREFEQIRVDAIHIDIMDAHFVPNMPLGLQIIDTLKANTKCPLDVHLMVDNNNFFIEEIAAKGVDSISVHCESAVHLDRSLALIRKNGIQAGVALNPATPIALLENVVHRIDFVLLMTVNPGFAGQTAVPGFARKIVNCKEFLADKNNDITIQVDGNVSLEHIPAMVSSGADNLVCGTSSIFRPDYSLAENANAVREAIQSGIGMRKTGSK